MKIVQSFWSCHKNLLENNFGWHTPQHHIMGWALSCLKLKEHYNDVILYTDSLGYKILIDSLQLPYKKVHVCFDSINPYHEALWALAKILTYAVQDEPFIHVDGDVFIWERFSKELEEAPLIAQNVEIGTIYYDTLMRNLKKELCYLPELLQKELDKNPISSYNAGIMGGNDIPFFKKYTQYALELINRNYIGNKPCTKSVNFNLLFEQILFHALASEENENVSCYFSKVYEDNGYPQKEIADFSSVPEKFRYLHLLGPHKKDKNTCKLMSQILFKEYPEYFLKVVSLFKEEHIHYDSKIKTLFPQIPVSGNTNKEKNKIEKFAYHRMCEVLAREIGKHESFSKEEMENFTNASTSYLIKSLYKYEEKLSQQMQSWETIPARYLYSMECDLVNNTDFFFLPIELQQGYIIETNSFVEIIETHCNWTSDIPTLLKQENVENSFIEKEVSIACVPGMFFNGFSEMVVDDLSYNILAILEEPVTIKELLKELEVCFAPEEIKNNYETFYELVLLKLKHLYYNRCVFIKTIINFNPSY